MVLTRKSLAFSGMFLAALSGFGASADAELRAGAARKSIVPPFPTQMGGFFDRDQTFTGVHSPIFARALVCDNGATRLAVVATDLIGVSRELVEKSRAAIADKTDIPAENVMISAAHNHSGPSGFQRLNHYGGEFNEPLLDFLIQQITAAVVEAHANLTPAHVGSGAGQLENFARNRQQNNETVIDTEVAVLKVTRADSRDVIATLFNFTGHPVVLGSDNLLLCGEFPGQAQQTVEAVLGGVALFTQGACGDVTVHRSGPPFLEVERLGRALAGEVITTAEMIRPTNDAVLFSKFQPVELEARKLPSPEQAERQLADAKQAHAKGKADGLTDRKLSRLGRDVGAAETTLRMAQFASRAATFFEAATHASVHVMQIGPMVLVGIPGELFVEFGLEMKQRTRQMTGKSMMLVGYANAYIGYIVTPRAKATGGYEQSVARVNEHAGRTLTETAMQLVESFVE